VDDRLLAPIWRAGWPTSTPEIGYNWKQPITEGNRTGSLWIRSFIPDAAVFDPIKTQGIVFRRQISKTVDSKVFLGHGFTLAAKILRPTDASMFVVCEIITGQNGLSPEDLKRWGLSPTDHPTPYARFPKVGPFSDFSDVNRLGESPQLAVFEYLS